MILIVITFFRLIKKPNFVKKNVGTKKWQNVAQQKEQHVALEGAQISMAWKLSSEQPPERLTPLDIMRHQ